MSNKDFLSGLNPQQKKATLLEDRNSLILAGAGSGKTKVLTSRIAYLCRDKGVSVENILAVTFTNKAAKEIQHRVEKMLGISTFGMWIGTFHGIAHRLLRKHAHELGLDKNFRILDQDEQAQLIKKVIKSLDLDDKKYPPKLLQNFINKQKDKAVRSNKLTKQYDINYAHIYTAYEERLLLDNALDFADLLLYLYELFSLNQQLREYYQSLFRYILIDEFQDTNQVQYMWLKLLVTDNNYMMAVGDDDQSIYGWRGAVVDNIHKYVADLNDVEIIKLEQNYRSTKNILKVANSVIKNNDNRMSKELWSAAEDGEKVEVYCAVNERDEAKYIIDKIRQLHDGGVDYSDIAILYRSNYLSRVLEESCIYASIPYRIYGGFRFFDRAEVKDALAYLRLAVTSNDNLAFERIINTPTRGIGNKTLDTIRNFSQINNVSYWQATIDIIQKEIVTKRTASLLLKFIEIINAISSQIKDLSLDKLLETVINESGLLASYQEKDTEKDRQKIDNLKELISAAKDFEPQIELLDDNTDILQDFLSFAVLEAGEMQADENTDSVQLMTIHASKGLEFRYVFLVAAEEGVFPPSSIINAEEAYTSSESKKIQEKLAEERRLFYVAVTRAMKALTISYAQVRNIFGRSSFQVKSRFLMEIDSEHINEGKLTVGSQNKPKLKQKSNFGVSPFDFLKSNDTKGNKFKKGDKVFHKVFGKGIFVKAQSQGSKEFYTVDFGVDVGQKILLADIANLVKV
ncbi:UvrD-helicase domain-containing protein [Francisella philomiragia]|uniref:UvrD-helicase domain-containing protein n=1 Tax=Francisella philomiragia TaxID=28110 RepID=UPI001905E960|nr:UvrD-helicase domain-containing protein [Francisella philomiragia]MBK2093117.1 exodeoxyribonuclease V subunit gamma [Francisella philomiragia]MBK2256757.1 exodeoxyribonuclease V subunit gamma [Francisella philomiragia]MBK2269415.1 exodeoxyribonuclease V subunit gamma [Francisella philomiragia]MBK2271220.1 exodeoxyribonuclease V subunit gamma [Francisella philomiragia]MBK2275000.1 exodeoxyribonuclease V subunit gamma [Francisella philomiragia]